MKFTYLDTTLRDGAQGAGVTFSLTDKLAAIEALLAFGADFVEAGNPGSNPKDSELFDILRSRGMDARICAFGATRRPGILAKDSPALHTLLESGAKTVSIFGKAWDFHVTAVLRTTLEENLAMIEDSVRFLKENGRRVLFDAEHFFDGYAADPAYAMAALAAADRGGADLLVLCDTNGGALPETVARVTQAVTARFGEKVGIHCHNDSGLAVACTMAAVSAGAVHVQGTVGGLGERCGNTDMCTLLPNLVLKMGCEPGGVQLGELTRLTGRIYSLINQPTPGKLPYVGRDAFAHKGGMHIDGVLKDARSFEHIDPATVGNTRSYLLSEVAGRAVLLEKLRAILPDLTDEAARRLCDRLKQLEYEGFQFDGAEDSFRLLVLREAGRMPAFFQVVDFKVIAGNPMETQISSALIKLSVNGRVEMTADEGNGPVDALDRALRKALCVFYPCLEKLHLVDFKVRVVDTGRGTASCVRVEMTSTDGESRWGTVGVSENILAASWSALVDSIECMLLKYETEELK